MRNVFPVCCSAKRDPERGFATSPSFLVFIGFFLFLLQLFASVVLAQNLVHDGRPSGELEDCCANPLATLEIRILFEGPIPERQYLDMGNHPDGKDKQILSEKMIVGNGGEIQNMVMYLDERRTKVELPKIVMKEKEVSVRAENCRFIPHVFAMQAGQSVAFTNADPVGHNMNLMVFHNNAFSALIPAKSDKLYKLTKPEPVPIPVECNIHPWMRAYAVITDHPYVGISNERGLLQILHLPIGEVTFRMWHENSVRYFDSGMLDGVPTDFQRGRVTFDLKPGINAYTIRIDASKFKK
ncbi:MAG: hypothetical protein AAF483_10600 [Planctomycetota bacterium]